MKLSFLLTFVFITLALRMAPAFSGESEESIPTTGFEINHFSIPSKLNLLAKSQSSHHIFNKMNQYKICLIKNKKQFTCGEFFEFDQHGQIYQLNPDKLLSLSTHQGRNLGKAYNLNIIRKQDLPTVQIEGQLGKKLFYMLKEVYIEKEETDLYVKERKEGVDISCLKIVLDENQKYSCQIKLTTHFVP
jgi:hypothetical protein